MVKKKHMHISTDKLSLEIWKARSYIYQQEFPALVYYSENDIQRSYVTLVYNVVNKQKKIVIVIIDNIPYEVLDDEKASSSPFRNCNTSDIDIVLKV